MTKFLTIILSTFSLVARADRTNRNQTNDFLDKSVPALPSIKENLKDIKNAAVDKLKEGGGSSPAGLDYITNKSAAQIHQETKDLKQSRANELNQKGINLLTEEKLVQSLHVDYSKPLNRQYKRDAKEFAKIHGNNFGQFSSLFDRLSDFGIDCQWSKGATQLEQVASSSIKKGIIENEEYNQIFCEQPSSHYQCRDVLSVYCSQKGWHWNDWQYREIDIAGDTVYHGAKHLGYSIKWKRKRHGWHITFDCPGWRAYLSGYLGIPIEQIGEQISFPAGARGIGSTHPVGERWRIVFEYYRFGYQYRDGHEFCSNWQESWSEKCVLQ